jgi:predicted signal transduction protein with EAL and GGDEF domain
VSGDEFVILCEDVTGPEAAELLAARIAHAFEAPVSIDGVRLVVTASVGVAFAGPGEEISEQLVAEADMAMYQAKHRGGAGREVIDLRELLRNHDHHTLEEDLRRACDEGSLDVVYQPIVRSCDGALTGVEALLRWTHPERGAIPPMTVVSLAEQSTLINDIGAWVLERACTDRGRWLQDHPDAPLELAVNVSAHQVMASDLRATVRTVLERTDMDPSALALELTENVFLHDSARAISVLTDLKELGIRLALDDFGTGYSALNYLRRLPIDIVKIDRSFVSDIDHAVEGVAIVAAVTNLAHVLGLTVTAEGVETSSQRDEIISLGCDRSQGFFYARPLPAEAIGEHLRAGARHPTHTAHLPVPIPA